MGLKFTKMHGNGNDFVVIEDLGGKLEGKENELAIKLCDRHFGVGADGILLVRSCKEAPVEMVIINSDGSYASMCGNGIRCFAKYVYHRGIVKDTSLEIKTGDGIKKVELILQEEKVKYIKVNMGEPKFEPELIPSSFKEKVINREISVNNKKYNITSMHMGVPHTVIFKKKHEFSIDEGSFIENFHKFPEGTNVNFCQVIDRKNLKVKTWERGAGHTLACGTGSCASAVASNLLGYTDNKVNIELDGGTIEIDLCNDGVYMIGEAQFVFEGNIL